MTDRVTDRTFGVAVLGAGIMGRRMLTAMRPHPRFRVVSLFDPQADAVRDARAIAPDARVATGVDDLVGDPAVDLVYVATPPALHLAGVRAAVAAGRACLCEKPLAATIDDAVALRDLVAGSGLPFAIHFPFASAPASRRWIERARAGDVARASIVARFAQWPRPWQAGAVDWLAGPAEGGFTREVLSHFVFLALRAFGPATVEDIRLDRATGHAETALRARLVHAGVTVTVDAAVAGDVADTNRCELVGSHDVVALVDWSRLEENGQISARVDAMPATLDRLARMLDGDADHALATVDEGLAVVRCIERLLQG